MSDEPTQGLTHALAKPAGRIAQVRKFRDVAGLRQGLCMSCLGTGFVHSERGGELGVNAHYLGKDRQGRDVHKLVRCGCPKGREKEREILESVTGRTDFTNKIMPRERDRYETEERAEYDYGK